MMFSKNVELMFLDDVVLCAVYVKQTSPSLALGKNRLLMKYGMATFLR
jgi:hypothetical protein